jgi:hypothetical protein
MKLQALHPITAGARPRPKGLRARAKALTSPHPEPSRLVTFCYSYAPFHLPPNSATHPPNSPAPFIYPQLHSQHRLRPSPPPSSLHSPSPRALCAALEAPPESASRASLATRPFLGRARTPPLSSSSCAPSELRAPRQPRSHSPRGLPPSAACYTRPSSSVSCLVHRPDHCLLV